MNTQPALFLGDCRSILKNNEVFSDSTEMAQAVEDGLVLSRASFVKLGGPARTRADEFGLKDSVMWSYNTASDIHRFYRVARQVDAESAAKAVAGIRRDLKAGVLGYTGDVTVDEYIEQIVDHDDSVKALDWIAKDMQGGLINSRSDDFSTEEYLVTVVYSSQ